MPYDPTIHHRRSTRLEGYDYSAPGAYFITICAEHREPMFGGIIDGRIITSPIGQAVRDCWHELPSKYPDLQLDAFILMPNHLHAILGICQATVGAGSPRPPSLGTVIGCFKYSSTKRVNAARNTPGARIWQRGYYDHVIRNNRSLDQIREYIATNPSRWESDADNPDGSRTDAVQEWVRTLEMAKQGGETPHLQR